MTPFRQVIHVLWKDLHEHWLRVAIFAALVAIALARALGARIPVGPSVLALCVLLGGIAIVASPVESDPPADARSFWAPRPLSPHAVLAAKLAFAALLLLVAGVAQAIAVWSLDLRTVDALRYVTGPSLPLALALLATLVVAAMGGAARARLLLVFALLIGFLLAATRLASADPVEPAIRAVAITLAAAVMLGALWFFYRRRERGWVTVLVAFAVLALAGVAAASRTLPAPMAEVASGVPRAEIRVGLPPGAETVERGHVRVRVSAVQPSRGWQYSMRQPKLEVTLAGGQVLRLDTPSGLMNLGGDPGTLPFPASESPRAMEEPARFREISIPVGQGLLAAEGDTIVRVRLSGPVLVSALRVVDTIPLVPGTSHARLGVRTLIDSVLTTPAGPEVVLRAVGLMRPDDQSRLFPFTSYFGRSYVLVGRGGERAPMRQTWTASSTGGLVLLSEAFGDAGLRLTPFEPTPTAHGSADVTWMRDAVLLAVEPRTQGSYPVSLEWKRGG